MIDQFITPTAVVYIPSKRTKNVKALIEQVDIIRIKTSQYDEYEHVGMLWEARSSLTRSRDTRSGKPGRLNLPPTKYQNLIPSNPCNPATGVLTATQWRFSSPYYITPPARLAKRLNFGISLFRPGAGRPRAISLCGGLFAQSVHCCLVQ